MQSNPGALLGFVSSMAIYISLKVGGESSCIKWVTILGNSAQKKNWKLSVKVALKNQRFCFIYNWKELNIKPQKRTINYNLQNF